MGNVGYTWQKLYENSKNQKDDRPMVLLFQHIAVMSISSKVRSYLLIFAVFVVMWYIAPKTPVNFT